MMFHRSALLIAVLFASATNAHIRWDCPVPRSSGDNIKQGPCGVGSQNPGIISDASKVEIAPGPLTLQFEETIRHQGSPYRIALSREGEDEYEDCILLNHIPHYDTRVSGLFYQITVDIPDVRCENCALQLIQVMTDKVRPLGTDCNYDVELSATNGIEGNCFSNYHSCANVRINGTTPRNDFTCAQPADWPFTMLDDFTYNQEVGNFSEPIDGIVGALLPVQPDGLTGGLLVPDRFNAPAPGCDADFIPAVNPGDGGDNGATSPADGTSGVAPIIPTTIISTTAAPIGAGNSSSGVLRLCATYATIMYLASSLSNAAF